MRSIASIKWGLLTTVTILGAVGVFLALPGCPPPTPVYFGDSVRILTMNVRMIPESWDDFCCEEDNEWRAERIADYLNKSDYDIVVLNEVFDEDSRDAFESDLKSRFPSYVRKIENGSMEDSGLMLFSRFPFEPLPPPQGAWPPWADAADVEAYKDGADWNDAIGILYADCVEEDCLSDKSVGFVRIKNPTGHRVYNVAFSHTQASYGEGNCRCEVDVRTYQFMDIQALFDYALGTRFLDEDVLLLGDLNVDGDQLMWERDNSTNTGYYATPECNPYIGGEDYECQSNLWEWIRRFDNPGEFYTDSMLDAWVFEQSPYAPDNAFDRGLTQGLPIAGERLDYAFRNRPANQQCAIQHLTLEREARKAGGAFLSDHIGLRIDFNRWSPRCNPIQAYIPPMDMFVPGEIQWQGSMQWYRIDESGTYLLGVLGTGMDFDVYEAKDLSTPDPQYFNETEAIEIPIAGAPPVKVVADKYVLPEAPFFIRVFHEDRSQTGNYQFFVHKATGASKEDAIVLVPSADWEKYEMPPSAPLNQYDEVWFELHVEKADSGVPQELNFYVSNLPEDNVDVELRKSNGVDVISTYTAPAADPDPPETPGTLRFFFDPTDAETGDGRIYLLVKRTQVKPLEFWTRWNTDLTVIHADVIPGAVEEMMICFEETDLKKSFPKDGNGSVLKQGGLDEIYLTITVDGTSLANNAYIGHYDDDYTYDLEPWIGTRRYLDEVVVTLRDDDDGNDDDYFTFTINALPRDLMHKLGEAPSIADNDGEYGLTYNRSRTLKQ